MTGRTYTAAFRRHAVAFVDQAVSDGETLQSAADCLGVPFGTLYRWLTEAGVRVGHFERRRSDRLCKDVAQLYQDGAPVAIIATLHGVTDTTVIKLAREAGIAARRRNVDIEAVHRLQRRMTADEIAMCLGHHKRTIRRILRDGAVGT